MPGTPDDHGQPSPAWAKACATLTHVVTGEAEVTARLVGFDWRGDPDAPADFRSLQSTYARCGFTGRPLPVSDQHIGSTIYTTATANLAYRFWHDVTHVRLGRGFDLDGEVAVAIAQLDVLRARGLGPGTLEYELFHTDTLGQTLCGAATGAFPGDQTCFARISLELDLARAIRSQLHATLRSEPGVTLGPSETPIQS